MKPLNVLSILFCLLLFSLTTVTAGVIDPSALIPTPTNGSFDNATETLEKRQCTASPEAGALEAWSCDYLFPTLDEIVARIRDLNDGGRATLDTHAVLYTGLGSASPSQEEIQKSMAWVAGAMMARVHSGHNFYWFFQSINNDCKSTLSSNMPLEAILN
jgi:hypothetical protein